MLIAISGSQGSGKTTVLNELKARGYNVVERKTSRSILSDWNVTLQEVNNNRELTLKFQDEIIARKYKDELVAAMAPSEIWFTERSFSDLFTYALVSLGKDNINSEWLDQYFIDCTEMNYELYKGVIYLRAGAFEVEHDGVRGSNQHYSTMVDLTMRHYTERMLPRDYFHELDDVGNVDLNKRVEFILQVADNV